MVASPRRRTGAGRAAPTRRSRTRRRPRWAPRHLRARVVLAAPRQEPVAPEVPAALGAQLSRSLEVLRPRMAAEPGVAGVTFVDPLPQDYHAGRRLEVEAMPELPSTWVALARIDPSYFDVLESPMIAGRAFTSADLSPEARAVIVDEGFVDLIMPGRSVIGQRVRLRTDAASSVTDLPCSAAVGLVQELGIAHAID